MDDKNQRLDWRKGKEGLNGGIRIYIFYEVLACSLATWGPQDFSSFQGEGTPSPCADIIENIYTCIYIALAVRRYFVDNLIRHAHTYIIIYISIHQMLVATN